MLGLYRDNGKENGNYYNGLYGDYYPQTLNPKSCNIGTAIRIPGFNS